MDICSDDHDDVAYTSIDCPVCGMRDDMQDQLDKALDDARNERDDLDQQLVDALDKLEKYKLLEDTIGGMIHERL